MHIYSYIIEQYITILSAQYHQMLQLASVKILMHLGLFTNNIGLGAKFV